MSSLCLYSWNPSHEESRLAQHRWLMLYLQVVYTYVQGIQWCLQIARGLECLHSATPTIVHRDVKLENMLLAGARSRLVQAVFGLMKLSKVLPCTKKEATPWREFMKPWLLKHRGICRY